MKKYYPQTTDNVPYKPKKHHTIKNMKIQTEQYRQTGLPDGTNQYDANPYDSMKKPPAHENMEALRFPTSAPKLKEPYYQYYPRVKYTTSPQLPTLEVEKITPPIINERFFSNRVESSQMFANNIGKGIQMKYPANRVRAPYPYEKPMLPYQNSVAVLKPKYSVLEAPKRSKPVQYYDR